MARTGEGISLAFIGGAILALFVVLVGLALLTGVGFGITWIF